MTKPYEGDRVRTAAVVRAPGGGVAKPAAARRQTGSGWSPNGRLLIAKPAAARRQTGNGSSPRGPDSAGKGGPAAPLPCLGQCKRQHRPRSGFTKAAAG
jgi:hypothetical protein